MAERRRVMFVYWGRRGALTQFTHDLARAAIAHPELDAMVSLSRQNESFGAFEKFGDRLFAVDTFSTNAGALSKSWRIPLLREHFCARLSRDRTDAVVTLLPHVWMPWIMPAVRREGIRYASIVHDAEPHPGDPTAIVHKLLLRDADAADVVVTMSHDVAERLIAAKRVPSDRILTLFHPDISYGPLQPRRTRSPDDPWRLLFLGRIMPYKGLRLFVEMAERLRARGLRVEIGVFGEGALGSDGERLRLLGAEVVNRWLSEAEVGDVLARYDVLVLSHIEASQSGVAATGLGAGLPIVATPVGALPEQVADGVTGLIARRADAEALVEAVSRLTSNAGLYDRLRANIELGRAHRSMARFVSEIARDPRLARRRI